MFYEQIIDECLKNGIEPLITICHFELPIALLEKYGGWRDRRTIAAFVRFAGTMFRHFKGKVKYWLTFNEINMLMHLPLAGPEFISSRERTQKRSSIRWPTMNWLQAPWP